MVTRGKIPYFAGIVDGEGHIGIYYAYSRKTAKMPSHYLRMSVGNTNKKLVNWISTNFGGWYNADIPYKDGKIYGKTCYRWALTGFEAYCLIKKIYPFLIVKKKQAKVGMVFMETRRIIRKRRNGNALTLIEFNKRERYRLKIKELNKMGIARRDLTKEHSLIRG